MMKRLWFQRAKRKLAAMAPVIADMLGLPERLFELRWADSGVAGTADNVIYVNWDYFRYHKDDWGALAHEYTHVVQHVPGGYAGSCGKWIEPMADCVRYKMGLFDPAVWHPTAEVLSLASLHEEEFKALSRNMAAGTC